jgi:hypothetical protein
MASDKPGLPWSGSPEPITATMGRRRTWLIMAGILVLSTATPRWNLPT